MHIMVPSSATRRGYGKQGDTTIDYFIYNEHFKNTADFNLQILTGTNISDHNLLLLNINFNNSHRKLKKNVIEVIDKKHIQKISL